MKRIWCLALALIMLTSSVFASSTQNKLNNTKNEIKDVQSQIKQNEAAQKDTLSEINSLDNSINSTERQINSIENEIRSLEESKIITEENIELLEIAIEENYDLKKNRVEAAQKYGNVSAKEISKKAKNSIDKINTERILNDVSKFFYDKDLEYEKDIEQLEAEKIKLEEDSLRCAELKKDLEVKLASLEETVEKRTAYLSKLEKDHKSLEKAEKDLKAEADKLTKELAALASKSSNSTYTGGTMKWPLPGHYVITSKFGNRLHPVLKKYSLHTGVDIAGSGCNGDPVVAAAAGTVIKATYSNSYGNYIIIDHGGGITTLYAHSSKLVVKAGDKVKAGQEIMKVGTTGYSTGPHLHFEVRKNGNYLNPLDGWIKS